VRISDEGSKEYEETDERITELAIYLATASLPFPATDQFEYWLLDAADDSPLALIFSCTQAEQMLTFPALTEWTALPAAVMPIETTLEEQQRSEAPVNYRLERLVAERAGSKPRARWFKRRPNEARSFPACLVREDWQDEEHYRLCQRYIQRQSTRLLMLHGLPHDDRGRLEFWAKSHSLEVDKFYRLNPEVADEKLMNAIRVEARLRSARGEKCTR